MIIHHTRGRTNALHAPLGYSISLLLCTQYYSAARGTIVLARCCAQMETTPFCCHYKTMDHIMTCMKLLPLPVLLYVLLVFRYATNKRTALRAGAAQGQEIIASTRRGQQYSIYATGRRSGAGLVLRTTPLALPPVPCWCIAVPTGAPTAHGLLLAMHNAPMTWQSIAVPTGGLPAHGPCTSIVPQQLLPAVRILYMNRRSFLPLGGLMCPPLGGQLCMYHFAHVRSGPSGLAPLPQKQRGRSVKQKQKS